MIDKAEKFYNKDKYKQAEELCLQMLENDPSNNDAARIQSLVMLKTNRIYEGIEFLKIALASQPNNPANNIAMGLYSLALQKTDEAINSFLRAYEHDNKNTEALMYLGDIYATQKDWPRAITFYALFINLDDTNLKMNQIYANNLSKCNFKEVIDSQRNAIERVLSDDRVNALKVIGQWNYMIFNDPEFEKLSNAILNRTHNLDDLKANLNSAFFVKGIEKLRHTTPIIEVFLRNIRLEILDKAINEDNFILSDYRDFLYALSIQCWKNEYVFYDSEDEKSNILILKDKIEESLANKVDEDTIISSIYLYATYASPLTIKNIASYTKSLARQGDDSFRKFVKIQIDDAIEEEKIKKNIVKFTSIDDSVSKMVQDMYEESPYPRSLEPVNIDAQTIENRPMDVLFAGCGTGYQILGFAQHYTKGIFTAVDLSASSLAYAIRQVKQRLNLKPKNMRFGQADILKLGEMKKTYDRIFCTGVLHHMEQPEEGLAVLKNILRPDGVMRLALYSETARKQIVEARNYLKDNGYKQTTEDIKRFRYHMIDLFSKGEHPDFMNFLVIPPDFYTTSECRDLIFHVQEHRYTIPEILDMLEKNNLEFISFNIKHDGIKQNFIDSFANIDLYNDPMKWHDYEQSYPHTFIEMYDFNVRHKQ